MVRPGASSRVQFRALRSEPDQRTFRRAPISHDRQSQSGEKRKQDHVHPDKQLPLSQHHELPRSGDHLREMGESLRMHGHKIMVSLLAV